MAQGHCNRLVNSIYKNATEKHKAWISFFSSIGRVHAGMLGAILKEAERSSILKGGGLCSVVPKSVELIDSES